MPSGCPFRQKLPRCGGPCRSSAGPQRSGRNTPGCAARRSGRSDNSCESKPNRPPRPAFHLKIEMLVRKGGFEPPRLSAPPPQDGVSASSTTSAESAAIITKDLCWADGTQQLQIGG